MEKSDILIIAGCVLIGFAFGVAAVYITFEVQPAPAVDSPPVCPGETYTPGTCGVDSNMTFYQCVPNSTGGGNGS